LDSDRRSLVSRIWASGSIQTVTPDIVGLVGLVLFGVGAWQLSRPATWMYAGAVLVVLCVLVERARPRKGRE
jgi:hypothetical protein